MSLNRRVNTNSLSRVKEVSSITKFRLLLEFSPSNNVATDCVKVEQ